MKCRIILVSLYFLLGCAHVPVPQPVPQIECRDREGQITYQGGYDEDRPGAYVRRPSPYEIIRYSKDFCKRSLEPVKEANRSPEPTPEARKSPDPVKKVNRSPQTAPAWESPDPVIEVSRSSQPVTAARKSPEPVKALSRPHGRAEALTKTFEERTTTANSLHKLAEAGNADAQNQVGLLYHEGRGVPQNFKLASHWFRKGAEQGHAGAQVNLGTLYFLGRGVSESDEEALFWFRKAAAQRDALAFAKLGRMYEQGRGVPLDFVHAHMCYNLSVAHGEKRAVENRDALTRQMDPDQIAEAQRLAVEWKPEDKGAYPTTSAGSRKEGL
jgi:hypothetical protein